MKQVPLGNGTKHRWSRERALRELVDEHLRTLTDEQVRVMIILIAKANKRGECDLSEDEIARLAYGSPTW